jgi:hypothetical protein
LGSFEIHNGISKIKYRLPTQTPIFIKMKPLNTLSRSVLSLSIIVSLASCSGVKFASVTPNLTLPSAYTSRSIYESGVAAYEFYDLVGNVLLISADSSVKPLRIAVVRPSMYADSVPYRLLTEQQSLNYYHSIITNGASAQGNYLAFAAKFSQDQIADYTLIDIAQASIPFSTTTFTEVVNGLKKYVENHPKPANGSKRIWVKSAVLSSTLYTAGNKISSNASGVIGTTIGVNGSVYNTNNQTIKGTVIGFDYFDIDELVGQPTKGMDEMIKTLEKSTQPLKLKGLQK